MSTEAQKRNAEQHLNSIIERYRSNHVMPAVCAGLVIGEELVYSYVEGVRKHGTNHKTKPGDLFQIASITKPLTGYLIARLIQQDKLRWDTTIGDIYPDIINGLEDQLGPGERAWSNHYRDTTIVDLMTHISGVDYAPRKETNAALGVADNPPNSTPNKNLIKKRELYTKLAVQDRPFDGEGWVTLSGGEREKYSGGCIIVASMAEKTMGKAWETLMIEHVLRPLGITQFAFGRISSRTSVTNTWHHRRQDGNIISTVEPNETQIAFTHGPAGSVSFSARDFGKLIAAIITNPNNFLKPAIRFAYLNARPGLNFTRGGWIGGNGRVSHDGNSDGWNCSTATIDVNKRLGVFACTNIGTKDAALVLHEICEEMEALGDAWEAVGYLHQAVNHSNVSASADSDWDNSGNYHATRVSDVWFQTRWASKIKTPTLTALLDQPRMLKGVTLCQAVEPRIQTFEIEISSGDGATRPKTLRGQTLEDQTTRSSNGFVIRTLFNAPTKVKKLKIKVKSASEAPTISRLLLLEYVGTAAKDFDIDLEGRLWVIDAANRVLTTGDSIGESSIVLGHDTGGVAFLVRTARSPTYLLGADSKVWKGAPNGWVQIADTVTSKRIAVDASNDFVWSINAHNMIRRYNGTSWVLPPGAGSGKDICVHSGTPYIVGMDDFIYRGISSGWLKLPGLSPKMKRIAVDEESGKLWALSTDTRIFSYNSATDAWNEHPGGGNGKAIAVHKSIPYLIGMDDAIWKSIGDNGWEKLRVFQDK